MTDAGKVTVGVEVNGSDLGAKLAAEIERAVRPAIAAVNKQLDELNARVKNLDHGGFDRLSSSARKAAASIHMTGTASRDAAILTTASVNRSIRDYERLARAAERSAARQIAAAASVDAAQAAMRNNTRQGGAGGGGQGSYGRNWYSGGSRGSRWTGGGGMGGFLTSPVGVNLAALGIGNLPALAALAGQAATAITQLSSAALILPGALAGIGASAGVAVIGFAGMGKAIKEFWTAFQSGDPKDLQKANEQIKNMAPAAQSAVRAFGSLFLMFQQMRQMTQQNMFAGVDTSLTQFASKSAPTFTKGLDQISKAWNNTLKELLRVGGLDSTQGLMSKIFGNTAQAQNQLNQAIEPFVRGMGTLAAAGTSALPRLSQIITDLTRRFESFITKADASGALDKWINSGITGLQHVLESVLNVGKAIANIGKAAGGDPLKWLEDATAKMNAFFGSARGQATLTKLFAEGREQMQAWKPILSELFMRILPAVIDASKRWSDILMPFLQAATTLLGKFPALTEAMVLGFLAFKTMSPFTGILRDLNLLNRGMTTAAGNARNLGGAVAGAGGGVIAGGGAGGAATGGRFRNAMTRFGASGVPQALGLAIGASQLMAGLDNAGGGGTGPGNMWQTTLGGAAAGGAIGSMIFPGLGTVIGGGLGAIGGGIAGLYQRDRYARDSGNAALAAPGRAQAAIELERQRAIDQLLYGTSGSFDPRKSGLAGVTRGSDAYNTLLGILSDPSSGWGQVGVNASNAPAMLDNLIRQAQQAGTALDKLGDKIETLPTGEIVLKNPTPEIEEQVKRLGFGIEHLPNGLVKIDTTQLDAANAKFNEFLDKYQLMLTTAGGLQVPGLPGVVPGPGKSSHSGVPSLPGLLLPDDGTGGSAGGVYRGWSGGGTLPGYSPGVDNMLVPLSGGEGIIIPEAMRALGGKWLYNLNSRFRGGISADGYAPGGVVGTNPWLNFGGPDISELQLAELQQMRMYLAGQRSGPLTGINQSLDEFVATGGLPPGVQLPPGSIPGRIGPFGTPIKPRNPQYDIMAGVIRALGGDPVLALGPNPIDYQQEQYKQLQQVLGGLTGNGTTALHPVDPSAYVGALQQFARTGVLSPEMVQLGLDANNPLVGQINTLRQKKDVDAEGIATLLQQGLTGGGYSGPITPDNQSLLAAMQTFREQLAKQQAQLSTVPGLAGALPPGVLPGGGLNWDALAQLEADGNWANRSNKGGKYMGGLQFDRDTWMQYRPPGAPENPADATKEQQIQAAMTALQQGRTPESLWPVNWRALYAPGATGAPNVGSGQVTIPGPPAPWTPGQPGAPAAPGAPPAPAGPPPGAVWMPSMNSWFLNGQKLDFPPPKPGEPYIIPSTGSPNAPVAPTPAPTLPNVLLPQTGPAPVVPAIPGRPESYGVGQGGPIAPSFQGPGGSYPSQTFALGSGALPFGGYGLPNGANSGGYGGSGVQFPTWVYQLGAMFNLKPSTYPGHQEKRGEGNQGIDWAGSPEDRQRFAEVLAQFAPGLPGLTDLIFENPNTNLDIGVNQGKRVGTPGSADPGYFRRGNNDFADHRDHVHTTIRDNLLLELQAAGFTGDPAQIAAAQAAASQGVAGAGGYAGAGGMPGGMSALGMGTSGVVPVYVTNWGGGTGGGAAQTGNIAGMLQGPLGTITGGVATAAGNVAGDIPGAVTDAAFGTFGANSFAPAGTPNAELTTLIRERNPLALGALAGLNIPDMSRQGPIGYGPNDIAPPGQQFDATGRLISNTTGLIQRSFTDMTGVMTNMRIQLVSATKQVADKLSDQVIGPVFQTGVTEGISLLPQAIMTSFGTSMGEAAAQPIASAVASSSSNAGMKTVANAPFDAMAGVIDAQGGGNSPVVGLFESGGGVYGGERGKDSVPALLMPDEWVLNREEVAKMGGFPGMQKFTKALATGGIRKFAAGGGVIGNSTVGADFFGVSQIPIIGAIVNLIIQTLLGVLGVQIKVRNTLNDITDEFRKFRGNFQAFNATGRLMTDTGAISSRSQSDEQTVADERIRIATIVITALIKYIIEKVIVPMIKAVLNALIQVGAQAAGGAVTGASMGMGGIGGQATTALISSLGQAGVDIGAQIGQDIAVNFVKAAVPMLFEGTQSLFPQLTTGLLGGAGLGTFLDPVGKVLGGVLGIPLGLVTALLGVVGAGGVLESGIGGALFNGLFDEGGEAHGIGLLPKATIKPERVLSPSNTESFNRLVDILASGGLKPGAQTTVHAPIHMHGSQATGESVRDNILALMT